MSSEKTKEFQSSRDGVAERERTAATLLAALVRTNDGIASIGAVTQAERDACAYAVALADALRAELAKEKP